MKYKMMISMHKPSYLNLSKNKHLQNRVSHYDVRPHSKRLVLSLIKSNLSQVLYEAVRDLGDFVEFKIPLSHCQ
jgi:hypothetical protein